MRSRKAASRRPPSRASLALIARRSSASWIATPARGAIASNRRRRRRRKDAEHLMCATQDEAGARNIDRGKTDAGAVEPRSDQRLAGEKWRPFDQPRAHLPACLGRQEKRRKPLCPAARQQRKLRCEGQQTHPFAARQSRRNDYLRQRKRIRLPCRDRRGFGSKILLCQALSLVGTRPQRTH